MGSDRVPCRCHPSCHRSILTLVILILSLKQHRSSLFIPQTALAIIISLVIIMLSLKQMGFDRVPVQVSPIMSSLDSAKRKGPLSPFSSFHQGGERPTLTLQRQVCSWSHFMIFNARRLRQGGGRPILTLQRQVLSLFELTSIIFELSSIRVKAPFELSS